MIKRTRRLQGTQTEGELLIFNRTGQFRTGRVTRCVPAQVNGVQLNTALVCPRTQCTTCPAVKPGEWDETLSGDKKRESIENPIVLLHKKPASVQKYTADSLTVLRPGIRCVRHA